MYNWIINFLTDGKIKVKVGTEPSNDFSFENGTPQGSVISPILFNITINYIFSNLSLCIKSALYVDDGAVWMRGRNVSEVLWGI